MEVQVMNAGEPEHATDHTDHMPAETQASSQCARCME
jgi:hypothetical protein